MLATRKKNWGEDRVMFFDDQGRLRSLPAGWTDVDPPEAVTAVAMGRAFLRGDDLKTLSALVGEIKSRYAGKRQSVK